MAKKSYLTINPNNPPHLNDLLKSLSPSDKNKITYASNHLHEKEREQLKKSSKPPLLLTDALIRKVDAFPYSALLQSIQADKRILGEEVFKNIWKNMETNIPLAHQAERNSETPNAVPEVFDKNPYKGQTLINSLADSMLEQFRQNPDKTYIFTSALTEALKTVSLNVKLKHLPKNICAFFRFPDLYYYDMQTNLRNHIEGVLVQTKESEEGGLLVSMVVFTQNYYGGMTDSSVNYFAPTSMDDAIFSSIKSNRHKDEDDLEGPIFANNNEDIIFMVFAGLVYLSSQKESVNDQFIKGKAQILPKKFTSCSYHVLGEGITSVRKNTSDSWEVSAHSRWQPCGPGFSQTRLVFIHNYTKKFHPVYIEDVEALEEESERPLYTQWEKNDRSLFIPKLKAFLATLGVEYALEEEYQVRKESFHKIDYVLKFPNQGIVLGMEYKSSKASWSKFKIEEQRAYYQFYLNRRYMGSSIKPRSKESYGVVETLLVSDNGKYGVSEDAVMAQIKELLTKG